MNFVTRCNVCFLSTVLEEKKYPAVYGAFKINRKPDAYQLSIIFTRVTISRTSKEPS